MTLNKKWQKEWEEIDIPHEKIHQLINEKVTEMPTKKRIKLNFKSPVMAFVYGIILTSGIGFLAFAVSGTPNQLKEDFSYTTNEATSEVSKSVEVGATFDDNEDSGEGSDTSKVITEHQIFKQSNDLKKDYDKIRQLMNDSKGMVVNSEVDLTGEDYSNPSANLTLNIPTDKVDDFLDKLEEVGKTTNSSTSQSDVSTEYFDNESRIKSLETEEKALLNLLEKSDKVGDMLTIQERLSVIRSDREDLIRGNKSLDKRIEYTTINLYLDEVKTSKPQKDDNFWDRVKLSWHNQQINLKLFGENLLVFLLSYGIYIIVALILMAVVVWKIKK